MICVSMTKIIITCSIHVLGEKSPYPTVVICKTKSDARCYLEIISRMKISLEWSASYRGMIYAVEETLP